MEAKQGQMSWCVHVADRGTHKPGEEKMVMARKELRNATRIHTELSGLPTYSHEGLGEWAREGEGRVRNL